MDEYVGIVKIFGGTFAPRGWVNCDGALLSIDQYQVLFAVIGTTYGGDGVTTFAVPDLRGRAAVGGGQGASGTNLAVELGEAGGEESHTLIVNEIPAHNHTALVNVVDATQGAATAGASMGTPGDISTGTFNASNGYNTVTPNVLLNPATISTSGGSQAHENRQPFLAVRYVICYDGLFPPHQ